MKRMTATVVLALQLACGTQPQQPQQRDIREVTIEGNWVTFSEANTNQHENTYIDIHVAPAPTSTCTLAVFTTSEFKLTRNIPFSYKLTLEPRSQADMYVKCKANGSAITTYTVVSDM